MRINSGVISDVAVTLLYLLGITVGGLRIKQAFSASESASTHRPRIIEQIQPTELPISGLPSSGSVTAKTAIVEFSDFQCPYCAAYSKGVLPTLKKEYVDTGQIAYLFMDFPLSAHPMATMAAVAGACAASQGRFWEMHDRLFLDQASLDAAAIVRDADYAGMEMGPFQECLTKADPETIKHRIAVAKHLGVSSTPTFAVGQLSPDGLLTVDTLIRGVQPIDLFRSVIVRHVATRSAATSSH